MNLSAYLEERRARIDAALEKVLPPPETRPAELHEAMRYCVLNGGKRIRPVLCLAAAELAGGDPETALTPALAVEIFHCSTLVHDDLPCMDDDDLRRGLPTCHIRYGEANAVLTGDALLILAFELLAAEGRSAEALELARAAGSRGVIAGQVEDLAAENRPPDPERLAFIHLHKTARLIEAALRMGAIAGGADDETVRVLGRFGERVGLAFQIEDDILDETSTDEELGKPVGSDREKKKLTYPAVYGLEEARRKAEELTREATALLRALPRDTGILEALAEYLLCRTR